MFALVPAVLICDQVIHLAENQQQKEVITVNFKRERERENNFFEKYLHPTSLTAKQRPCQHGNDF